MASFGVELDLGFWDGFGGWIDAGLELRLGLALDLGFQVGFGVLSWV